MPAVPQILKTIVFTLDTEDFSLDVVEAEVVPEPGDIQSVTTLDGVTHQDAAGETWALRLVSVIDWDSTRPGLASYLMTNKGTQVAFALKDTTVANSATKPRITGTVTLVPLPYGGPGNAFATAEVLLPLTGDPVLDESP